MFNEYSKLDMEIYLMGIGDWGLGPIPNPQSPIPNPQSPLFYINLIFYFYFIKL